jgi:hypothetical protein
MYFEAIREGNQILQRNVSSHLPVEGHSVPRVSRLNKRKGVQALGALDVRNLGNSNVILKINSR